MMATLAVAGVDAVLAACLLAVYAALYRRMHASASLGFASVSSFFLAQNVWALVGFTTTLASIPGALAPVLLVIGLLELGGLAGMVWMAWK